MQTTTAKKYTEAPCEMTLGGVLGEVFLGLGRPVSYLRLTPGQARKLGLDLARAADEAEKLGGRERDAAA